MDLFEEFEIDWTILDMSSAADMQELGLDDATIAKIMAGLGKDPKIGSALAEKPISISKEGNLLLKSSLQDLVPSMTELDPRFKVELREIRVQKKIGIGGYAEVWKAQWRGKTVAFKLLQEETMEQTRVVEEFR